MTTEVLREADRVRESLHFQGLTDEADLIAALRDAIKDLRSELAELTLSRAELADEVQRLRDWRDGENRENARRAAIAAVTPCSCSAQRARADRAESALAEAHRAIVRVEDHAKESNR